jgi:hypothetical protein
VGVRVAYDAQLQEVLYAQQGQDHGFDHPDLVASVVVEQLRRRELDVPATSVQLAPTGRQAFLTQSVSGP